MLFNSLEFWCFFAIVLCVYQCLGHRQQNAMLLVASYFFYGCWDWRFLSLIAISTVVDYKVGRSLAISSSARVRRRWLLVSVCVNLGILGFFKYYNFFAVELATWLERIGITNSVYTLKILLPVGISFYTFQTMGYTVDVFRGRISACRDFIDFALYVAFFPQLVAGPIERANRLLGQIALPRQVTTWDFRVGLWLVLLGLFKKVVIADNMAPIVDTIFAERAVGQASFNGTEMMLGLYAFAFQIYGDFSGYSSIAQGISRWLGFDLVDNFKHPYFSRSPSEFWSRWHISLSGWLRDYLYIPLGGNRFGSMKTLRNLLVTMLLGGLWHGANWTFVAWGAYHGMLLCLFRIGLPPPSSHLPEGTNGRRVETFAREQRQRSPHATAWDFRQFCRMVVFFHLTCIGWLFFRADSLSQVWSIAQQVFSTQAITSFSISGGCYLAWFVVPMVGFEFWLERKQDLLAVLQSHWVFRSLVYGYLVWMIIIFAPESRNEFIYFQF